MTPVLLFTYKRADLTRQTVEALKRNKGAQHTELFIFSDGAKTENDVAKVNAVREYCRTIGGFKTVHLVESPSNKGLANSIISGVTQIINIHDRAIILEDDLVTSTNFLSFCNQALDRYQDNPEVLSVGAYTRPVRGLEPYQVYFTRRATSWGWATWKDRWNRVDWEVKDFAQFSADRDAQKKFNEMGSDMTSMLHRQMRGEMSSWAIRWCYHQFRHSLYTVFPAVSKVANFGLGADATHTKERFNRFRTELDTSGITRFEFTDEIGMDKKIIRQFVKPYSIPERLKYKLLNALPAFK